MLRRFYERRNLLKEKNFDLLSASVIESIRSTEVDLIYGTSSTTGSVLAILIDSAGLLGMLVVVWWNDFS